MLRTHPFEFPVVHAHHFQVLCFGERWAGAEGVGSVYLDVVDFVEVGMVAVEVVTECRFYDESVQHRHRLVLASDFVIRQQVLHVLTEYLPGVGRRENQIRILGEETDFELKTDAFTARSEKVQRFQIVFGCVYLDVVDLNVPNTFFAITFELNIVLTKFCTQNLSTYWGGLENDTVMSHEGS